MLTYADVCLEAVLCQEEPCALLLLKKSVVREHKSMLTDADGC
jgi:hypothetical protein